MSECKECAKHIEKARLEIGRRALIQTQFTRLEADFASVCEENADLQAKLAALQARQDEKV